MDLFDMTSSTLQELRMLPARSSSTPNDPDIPPKPAFMTTSHSKSHPPPPNPPAHLEDLAEGLAPIAHIPTLVLGVQSDILFPVDQQREVADALRMAGNQRVSYYELGGVWGHDTFLYGFLVIPFFAAYSLCGLGLMCKTLEVLCAGFWLFHERIRNNCIFYVLLIESNYTVHSEFRLRHGSRPLLCTAVTVRLLHVHLLS
jgi:hypothetical protein